MTILLTGLLILPMIVGLLLLGVARKAVMARHYVVFAATAVSFACSLGLLWFAEQDLQLPFIWLPGSEHWSLHVGGTGLYALILTGACALVVRIIALASERESRPELDVVFLIALGSSNMAFLAGHFLARYLALELVALCVAAACLIQLRDEAGTRAAGYVYLLLRVGDAGLLAAILLLLDAANTLDIGEALMAGMALEGRPVLWISAALSLAVWVKVGAWPFHGWQRVGLALPTAPGVWLHGILMPQLGLYLLYRVAPLLASGGLMQIVLIALGLGSAAVTAELWMRAGEKPEALQIYGGAMLGSLAIAGAAAGFTTGLAILLVAIAPLRLWIGLKNSARGSLLLLQPARRFENALVVRVAPEGGDSLRVPASATGLLMSGAQALRDTVEQGAFGQGPMKATRLVMSGAEALRHTVEQGVFEEGPARMTRAVLDGAGTLQDMVERGGFESLLQGTAHMVLALSRGIQRLHTGKLRTGLLWVVMTLLAVILLVRAQ